MNYNDKMCFSILLLSIYIIFVYSLGQSLEYCISEMVVFGIVIAGFAKQEKRIESLRPKIVDTSNKITKRTFFYSNCYSGLELFNWGFLD